MEKVANLYTAQELEELLGKKYFYRQGIYRLAEDGKINSYQVSGVLYFSRAELTLAALNKLVERIRYRYPWVTRFPLKVRDTDSKEIIVYGFPDGREIAADTESETEEDLLNKLEILREEVTRMADIPVNPPHEPGPLPPPQGHHGPPPPPPHHGPPPHHLEMMEALRRIEDKLSRIEEKIG
ncbi:MAG: helix-turn-helix domain-containing protein [bacterium]|nr:helix-turn-helix domain-containing protein [bacterium]